MRRNSHSIRDIATTLGRSVDTVSDELKRNQAARARMADTALTYATEEWGHIWRTPRALLLGHFVPKKRA